MLALFVKAAEKVDDLLIGETIDFDNELPNDNSEGKEL